MGAVQVGERCQFVCFVSCGRCRKLLKKKVAQKRTSILSILGPFGALTINEMKKKREKNPEPPLDDAAVTVS